MVNFQEFCNRLTTDKLVLLHDAGEESVVNFDMEREIPKEFHDSFIVLKEHILPKRDRLDKVRISFIEAAFSDMGKVVDILTREYNQDISDQLMRAFSMHIFGCPFNKLNRDGQSIIIVLATYLMIQKFV
jgi:hypothetical protein